MGVRFKRQHPIWIYIADFYRHEIKLVIEIDGSIYNLKEVKENDTIREEDITRFGIKVIRFTNHEIKMQIENILEKIQRIINEVKNTEINNEKQN